MRYEEILRIAYHEMKLSVIRQVHRDVLLHGMDEDQTIEITLKSKAEGVKLPTVVVNKYPDEITIVLEHEFDNLELGDTSISVDISFGGVLSKVVVPFSAIIAFGDPYTDFEINFDPDDNFEDLPGGNEKSYDHGGNVLDFQKFKDQHGAR